MDNKMKRKRGVIFDVDGTLWDACKAIADSWNEYIHLYEPSLKGRVTGTLIRSLCGQPMDKFAAAIFPDEEPGRAGNVTEACCLYEVGYLREKECGVTYPHIREVLTTLKSAGDHLYIVSNCQLGYIEAFLSCTDLADFFEDTECYGHTLKGKGENIRLLMQRNHLDEAVYLGDTQGDYEAAQSAAIPFIWASYGFGQVNDKVPAIQNLQELPEKVALVFA